jgi:hypothetical protein
MASQARAINSKIRRDSDNLNDHRRVSDPVEKYRMGANMKSLIADFAGFSEVPSDDLNNALDSESENSSDIDSMHESLSSEILKQKTEDLEANQLNKQIVKSRFN